MPLILCHSPKGGVGTSFIAAQVAIHLAQRGHDVSALDFTYQEALKLFFGLTPAQSLPELNDGSADPIAVSGVALYSAQSLCRDPHFIDLIGRKDHSPFETRKIYVADVAAGDRETKDMLLPYAALHICTLQPRPGSLAALPKVEPGTPTIDLPKTGFVLNHLDDTHRLSRHTHIFLRELFGSKLLGTVRRDEAVNEASAMFEPIARFAPASVVLSDLRKLAISVEQQCGLADPAVAAAQ
ncbi:cellulose synthase operon protein YhjQ/BcsQ [Sphingobium sp. AP49]|uniref:ParA family protein n=1 Tax=Sphingobium sp. AP49 TaxID=1144307 RepID=UPI00026ED8DF|nr:cellulose synthase operon protein YhjQ/BcsQ [Sphingobium sp. AP49]WHO37290.1 cellulose synthase operon protein YhjQ/BcsQ [Sphingobium sp. AP49]